MINAIEEYSYFHLKSVDVKYPYLFHLSMVFHLVFINDYVSIHKRSSYLPHKAIRCPRFYNNRKVSLPSNMYLSQYILDYL